MSRGGVDVRVLVLAIARMADSVCSSFLIVVLPLFIASGQLSEGPFGLSEALIAGLVIGLYELISSPLQPFAGRASDRVGRRKEFVVLGLVILVLTTAAFPFASNYVELLAIRVGQGFSVALTVTATVALINEYSTDESRGKNMGLYNTFRLAGFAVGPILAGLVLEGGPYSVAGVRISGFEGAFYAAAATAVLGIVLVLLFVHDPEELEADAGEDFSIGILNRDGDTALDTIFTLGLATWFMALAIALLEPLQPQVNARLDQGPFLFGVEFGSLMLALLLVQVPIGAASDKWGRKPLLLAGMVLLVPTTLALGLVTTPLQMIVARFFQGLAAALVLAPALALAGDLADVGESGTKLSVLTMAWGLGIGLGPITSGYLVKYGFEVPFVFGASLGALGLVLVHTQVKETVTHDETKGKSPAPTD